MPPDAPPNPDTLLGRVENDLAENRAWRARRRLVIYVSRFGDEPRYARRLGELLLEIEEWPSAGEAFIKGGSTDEQHQALMADQLRRLKNLGEFRELIRDCLKRAADGVELPTSVINAIQERELPLDQEIEWACRIPNERKGSQAWLPIGTGCNVAALCAALCLLAVIMVLGVKSLLKIISDL